jgi:ribosomal protein L37AE/L43A
MTADARYRHPADVPDCPNCEGHIFVDSASGNRMWICYRCDLEFEEPIEYSAKREGA